MIEGRRKEKCALKFNGNRRIFDIHIPHHVILKTDTGKAGAMKGAVIFKSVAMNRGEKSGRAK